jgi:ribosomal protein L40E
MWATNNKEVKADMFCPKCGEKNPDDSRFCSKCGAALVIPTAPAPAPASAPATAPSVAGERTSGMAITSLVTGIAGFLFYPVAVIAIIFGAIAMGQINKDPTLKGKGMAITGLVLGIVVCAIWIITLVFWGAAFWWLL